MNILSAFKQGICILLLLLGLTACSKEDDVIDIFNEKTWKLSRLTNEGSSSQFYSGLWGGDANLQKISMQNLKQSGFYIINFNVENKNGIITGDMNVTGVKATLTATVNIDPSTRKITLSKINRRGTEAEDKLAAEFIKGAQNISRYEGDVNNITLYYTDGNATKIMGFTIAK